MGIGEEMTDINTYWPNILHLWAEEMVLSCDVVAFLVNAGFVKWGQK